MASRTFLGSGGDSRIPLGSPAENARGRHSSSYTMSMALPPPRPSRRVSFPELLPPSRIVLEVLSQRPRGVVWYMRHVVNRSVGRLRVAIRRMRRNPRCYPPHPGFSWKPDDQSRRPLHWCSWGLESGFKHVTRNLSINGEQPRFAQAFSPFFPLSTCNVHNQSLRARQPHNGIGWAPGCATSAAVPLG